MFFDVDICCLNFRTSFSVTMSKVLVALMVVTVAVAAQGETYLHYVM